MRRALIILASFLVAAGIIFGVFTAYRYHEEETEFDDLSVKYSYINYDGGFTGSFKSTREGRTLCGYEYSIDGDTLYITFFQTAGDKKSMEIGKDGYTEITIPDCKGIDKIFYLYDGEAEDEIAFNK